MAQTRIGGCRLGVVLALVLSWTLVWVAQQPAGADVTSVKGSAFGYTTSVSLFGGPATVRPCTDAPTNTTGCAPAPAVTLPAAGSASPVTLTAATGDARYGPGIIFTSGPISVTTQGTIGATGSVTSSTSIDNVNTSGAEVLTAGKVTSTCTGSSAGVLSGSTTITGGVVQTDDGAGTTTPPHPAHTPTTVTVPANPAPNTIVNGIVESVGDTFEYVFNEQITNADGSLTINAAHQKLLGPTAVGDLIIGQSVCGVSSGATTSSSSTSTTVAGLTSSTTAQATTTTTAAGSGGGVGGGAFGYFTKISLFGGPAAERGPAPTVTLPATGSATPITATVATGDARFGPGVFFTSKAITVSTEGTTSPKSVTSSTKITQTNTSGLETLTAAEVSSTCKATESGVTGSSTITGGTLRTSELPDPDGTVVPVPANPAPNTTITGKLEGVGDTFKYVFNEQITTPNGSITVNAAHQYALGPTAVGELIVGQSRCATTSTAFTGTTPGQGGGGTAALTAAAAGGGSGLAKTGSDALRLFTLGLVLVSAGLVATLLGQRLVPAPVGNHRRRSSRGRDLLRRVAERGGAAGPTRHR